MLQAFKEHIEKNFPDLFVQQSLLACSGGVDSVVLAHLCHNAGLNFSLAHCNFQLRGSESDKDEQLVRNLAKALDKNIHVIHFDTIGYMNKNKSTVQIATRNLRYQWFAKIMEENNIPTLMTAHHADDNLETFLINLSRGTGIDGLTGIPEKTPTISRPLLPFSRDEIKVYAISKGIQWREDGSNSETKYLRNNIRHNIVPLLKELHPTFLQNFKATQKRLVATSEIAADHIQKIKEDIFTDDGEMVKIEISVLKHLHPLKGYLFGLFKDYGFTEWNDVANLLSASSGKEIHSKTHRLVKDREFLLLSKFLPEDEQVFTIKENEAEVDYPISLHFQQVSKIGEQGKNVLFVDKETLKYPLRLRKWKKGDYFYPLGMQGKKKLSKFFKDEKVDVISKQRQWLLCSDDKIVWVIGRRPDERFKITDATNKIVKVTWAK